ncbi:MAG: S9 family peptidase [Gemmatimonadales bacterium]|nr:MAG: S9 family peptidase [Gemmatimonadales bacterium]
MRKRPAVRVLLAALAVTTVPVFSPVPAAAQEPQDLLTLEHYLDWEFVQSPQLSPDGGELIYTREWIDKVNDRHANQVWIMNRDGTRNRFLLDGSQAAWSPDGTRIAFVAPGSPRGAQIHVRWMDAEGAVSQVTRLTGSPSNIQWSPDGRWIAFNMLEEVGPDPAWRIDMPPRPDGATWTAPPIIEERLNWRRDGSGWSPNGFRHIYVVAAEGGTPRKVTSGDFDHGAPEWMPDGRSIVFSGLRMADAEYQYRESAVYRVDLDSGEIRQLTSRRGSESSPLPSPDGRWIAFRGNEFTRDTYREQELSVMRADGSGIRVLAREMGGMGNVAWASDGSGLYLTAAMRGTSNLWFVPMDGDPRQVTQGSHMLSVSHIDGDGQAVGVRTSYHEPGSLVAFHVERPAAMTVLWETNAAVLDQVTLGEVEEVWYESVDGLEIQGWIVKPPHFDPASKYPLILRIHGGPHSMYNAGFDFKNQDHAANGFVVLYTNPRGSSGYGSEFGNAINYAYPSMDYDDLMAGVDEVISRGYIDERNLFVYGGSGGGVLTSWIVGHTDRFTAAVSKAPVTNWISFVGTTDGSSWYYDFEKHFWEDPSEHLRRSPLMYVGNVTTPTMLMTGERDLRTPMEQTEQFYRALKLRRVPTAMVRLTDGWHSRSRPPTNFIRVQLLLRNWFNRYRVGGDPVTN